MLTEPCVFWRLIELQAPPRRLYCPHRAKPSWRVNIAPDASPDPLSGQLKVVSIHLGRSSLTPLSGQLKVLSLYQGRSSLTILVLST